MDKTNDNIEYIDTIISNLERTVETFEEETDKHLYKLKEVNIIIYYYKKESL